MARYDLSTPEGRARKRVESRSAMLWHIVAYVIVNAFMVFLDINGGGGIDWAIWVIVPWGIGLAFHLGAYFIEERGIEERKYQEYLEEEKKRDLQPH